MPFADTRANILGGGLASIKVKAIGDDAHYALPFFRDGTIEVTQISSGLDPREREYGVALLVTITARTMATDMANLIELMDTFCAKDLHVKATALNGTKFFSQDIGATTGYMGHKLRLMSEGDFSADRYIEFTFTRACTATEYAAAVAGTVPDGTPNVTDALYLMNSLVRSDMTAAAFTRFQFRETSSGAWDDSLTNIRNGSFTAETVGTADTFRRERPHAIRVSFSLDCIQANTAEVALVDDVSGRENDYQIAFPDCYVTLDGKCGVNVSWTLPGGLAEPAFIRFTGNGVVLPSEWDAMWTAGAPA